MFISTTEMEPFLSFFDVRKSFPCFLFHPNKGYVTSASFVMYGYVTSASFLIFCLYKGNFVMIGYQFYKKSHA